MQQEWDCRARYLEVCVDDCRRHGIKIPTQRAITMPRFTPQELELALFRARAEENRMRLRLSRKSLLDDSRRYAEDGDHENARIYRHFVMSPDYNSDSFMSDEE